MRRFLAVIAVSVFSSGFTFPLEDPIPAAIDVSSYHLDGGSKVYVQEHAHPEGAVCLKAVLKGHGLREIVYTFEGNVNDLDALDAFLGQCSERARGNVNDTFDKRHADKFSSAFFGTEIPGEVTLIAVGDIPTATLFPLLAKHFASVQLASMNTLWPDVFVDRTDLFSQAAIRISFDREAKPVVTYADLKEYWTGLIVQELIDKLLGEHAERLGGTWLHTFPHFSHPEVGFALLEAEKIEQMLAALKQGFYASDLRAIKQDCLLNLRYLALTAQRPDSSFLASYYKDNLSLKVEPRSSAEFLEASIECIEGISPQEIVEALAVLVDQRKKNIHLIYSNAYEGPFLTEENIAAMIDPIQADATNQNEEPAPTHLRPCNNPIQDEPLFILASHASGSTQPFYSLALSKEDQNNIRFIISTMAKENLVQLAFSKGTLEKKGKKIEHVHPLRFMGYILSQRELKQALKQVRKSSFKWDHFIGGFARRMKDEHSHNNLHAYIPGFAQQVGCREELVRRYIHHKDWEGLVKALL